MMNFFSPAFSPIGFKLSKTSQVNKLWVETTTNHTDINRVPSSGSDYKWGCESEFSVLLWSICHWEVDTNKRKDPLILNQRISESSSIIIIIQYWKLLLVNVKWARRKVDFKMDKFRENPDLGQDLSRSEGDLGWDLKKNEQKCKKKSVHELDRTWKLFRTCYLKSRIFMIFFTANFVFSDQNFLDLEIFGFGNLKIHSLPTDLLHIRIETTFSKPKNLEIQKILIIKNEIGYKEYHKDTGF